MSKKNKVCLEEGQIENIINAAIAIREGTEDDPTLCPTALEYDRETFDIKPRDDINVMIQSDMQQKAEKKKEDKKKEKTIKKWVDRVDKGLERKAKETIEKFTSFF